MSLHEQVQALYLLDKQVRGLESRQNLAARRLNAQKKKLEKLEAQFTELNSQFMDLRSKTSLLENELKSKEERVEKARNEMNQVRTNKEYSALLVEMNTLKDDKGAIEDVLLKRMEEQDGKESQVSEIKHQIDSQSKIVDMAAGEVESSKAEVRDQLDEVKDKFENAKQDIPKHIMAIYDDAIELNDGDALATINEENRRHMEYTCGGCFMIIPVERVNRVMSMQNDVTTCPSCSRILMMNSELIEELRA